MMGKNQELRQNNSKMSLEEIRAAVAELVERGEINIEASPPDPVQPEPVQPEPAAPPKPKIHEPESQKPKETRKPVTLAGPVQYSNFFSLYAKVVQERRNGRRLISFRSLGYIPGPAIVLEYRDGGEIRIIAATPDVAKTIGALPTNWMLWDKTPERVRQALAQYKAIVDGLGYEPSPWNLGLAMGLMRGVAPAKYLAMIMSNFRYRPGDPERPFGVALLPVWEGWILKGLKVKIFNPAGIPDCPTENTLLQITDLNDGDGPVQKLIKTWAKMENNFSSRYDRTGKLRQNDGQAQTGQPKFRQPTW